jgi:hypothetical protein
LAIHMTVTADVKHEPLNCTRETEMPVRRLIPSSALAFQAFFPATMSNSIKLTSLTTATRLEVGPWS